MRKLNIKSILIVLLIFVILVLSNSLIYLINGIKPLKESNVYYREIYIEILSIDSVRNAEYDKIQLHMDTINMTYDTIEARQIRKGILKPNEFKK